LEEEMKKYIAKKAAWSTNISEVDVERESGSSVWIAGRRHAKRSEWENYFDTWEQAHQFLLDLAQEEVDSCRLQLERAKGYLGNIKGMKKPL
jgi:hypothetical protein